jgi:ubiquinone/menaquinone biosynthesis C-methylase UbiE
MIPWYKESFGLAYLDLYAHRDDREAQKDIQTIVKLISPPEDEPLLDLGCGAGRHLCVLRDMGFSQLVGLDLSQELLDVAAKQLADPGIGDSDSRVQLIQADMRAIPQTDYFATVLSLFTSFGYFERDDENENVLAAVHRALKPGGTFLIDYMNRGHVIAHLVAYDEKVLTDRRIKNTRCLTADSRRVEKTTLVIRDGVEHQFHESVRLYSADEMVDMLEAVGFESIQRYGSLDGEEFTPTSPRLVIVARKGQAI